jgi:ribosomal protein S18 acetylase RimI-like enzyme
VHTATTNELAGRDAILAATDHHPYTRRNTGGGDMRGLGDGSSAVWITDSPGRTPILDALGDPARVPRLLAELRDRGELAGVRRIHLPRVDTAALAAVVPVGEPDLWDFRWTSTPPPEQPGEERVVRLGTDAAPAIGALLDHALPDTFTRPSGGGIQQWYGVWDGGRLVACGADKSRGGVGSLAGIAVDPDLRGRGIGAALTAAMARELARNYDVVALGVMADNDPAIRLYQRLGFTDCALRTSVDLRH